MEITNVSTAVSNGKSNNIINANETTFHFK